MLYFGVLYPRWRNATWISCCWGFVTNRVTMYKKRRLVKSMLSWAEAPAVLRQVLLTGKIITYIILTSVIQ